MFISPYTYLQALFDSTSTSTSLRVEDRDPPEDLVPHPVTVAVTPTYVSLVSVGRHTGLMWGLAEKSTAFFSLSIEKSSSVVELSYPEYCLIWSMFIRRWLASEVVVYLCSPSSTCTIFVEMLPHLRP